MNIVIIIVAIIVSIVAAIIVAAIIAASRKMSEVSGRGPSNTQVKKKTYIINGASGLDHRELRKILDAKGWTELELAKCVKFGTQVDLAWIEQFTATKKFDPLSYEIKANIKNIFSNKNTLVNKSLLSKELHKQIPASKDYLPETYSTTYITRELFDTHKVWIVKPVGLDACSGKDIFIVNTLADFEKAREKLSSYPDSIACKYIDNPMLVDGHKFHLRMYMLVSQINKELKWDLWDTGKILIARLPYKSGDYFNADIHDTHAGSTPRNMYFPKDYPANDTQSSVIFEQIRKICSDLIKISASEFKPYPESKNAFEVFGLDFLVDETGKVFILEGNARVGFYPCGIPAGWDPENYDYTPDYSEFSENYYEWVLENIGII